MKLERAVKGKAADRQQKKSPLKCSETNIMEFYQICNDVLTLI